MKTSQPKILYHYTTMSVLCSLLNNLEYSIDKEGNPNYKLKFWISDYRYMNDWSESIFFLNTIGNAFLRYQKKYSLEDKSAYFTTTFSLWDQLKGDKYILSLSENEDSLTMWRGYGANGQGVAIGLNAEKILQFISENSSVYFFKMNYVNIATHMMSFSEKDLEQIYNDIKIEDDGSVSGSWGSFSELYEANYLSYKNEAYRDENEWRLTLIKDKECKYRENNGVIIPYCEIKIPIEFVENIIIGPSANKELSKLTLQNMIDHKIKVEPIANNIKISNSDIPYKIK